MNNFFAFLARHKLAVATVAVVLVVASVVAFRLRPCSDDDVRRSTVMIECRSWYEVGCGGRAILYFKQIEGDTAMSEMTPDSSVAVARRLTAGLWADRIPGFPSCMGRIVTVGPRPQTVVTGGTAALADSCLARMKERLETLKSEKRELDYYFRVHGVKDNGYQEIAVYAAGKKRQLDGLSRAVALLDSIGDMKKLSIRRRTDYRVLFRDEHGCVKTMQCRFVGADDKSRAVLLQTADGQMPEGVEALNLLPWNAGFVRKIIVAGFPGISFDAFADKEARLELIPGRYGKGRHDVPSLLASDGSPVFTAHGRLVGISCNGSVIPRRRLSLMVLKGGME